MGFRMGFRIDEYELAMKDSINSDITHDPETGDTFRILYKIKVKVFKFESPEDIALYEEIKTIIYKGEYLQYSESESWTKDGERCHHLLTWGEPYKEKIDKSEI